MVTVSWESARGYAFGFTPPSAVACSNSSHSDFNTFNTRCSGHYSCLLLLAERPRIPLFCKGWLTIFQFLLSAYNASLRRSTSSFHNVNSAYKRLTRADLWLIPIPITLVPE